MSRIESRRFSPVFAAFVWAGAFLLLAGGLVDSQEVFAPFPSRIRVATKDPQVRLSWDDASDLSARYLIYRHTEEISLDTLDDAELVGVVDGGVEAFIDTPTEPGSYFYAVLAQDDDDTIYEVVVPFRNTIVTPVEITSVATEAERAAQVRNLSATPRETTIVVEFSSGRTGRTLALYRSINAIRNTEDLAGATKVATVASTQTQFVDYPVPGVGYHYAVLDTEVIAEGRVDLIPGENTTEAASEIALPEQARPAAEPPELAGLAGLGSARSQPLPFFQIQGAVERGSMVFGGAGPRIPETQPLDPETDKAVVQLIRLAGRERRAAPEVETLPDEETTPADADGAKGLDLTLRTIVEGPMKQGNWDEALLVLTNFLRLPLSEELTYRANFYLGQSYYFTEEYRRAALAFLTAQEGYYPQATRWLDRALRVFPDE